RVERRVRAALGARSIAVRLGARAVAVGPGLLSLQGAPALPFDLLLWSAGAAALSWLRESGLPTDEHGWVRVRDTLEVVGQERIFAAGDCAVLEGRPPLPRAGVFAVRQAPVLAANLRAALEGHPLRR